MDNELNNKIEELRQLIHNSATVKQSVWELRGEGNWNLLWSGIDNIKDAQKAIDMYPESNGKLVEAYGVMQALTIQRESLKQIEKALDLDSFDYSDYPRLQEINDIRIETTGHPAETQRSSRARTIGESTYTTIISADSHKIEYLLRSGSNSETINVDIVEIISDQESLLTQEINNILTKLQEVENEHRENFMNEPIEPILLNVQYHLGVLSSSEDSREYAKINLEEIKRIYEEFQTAYRQRYGGNSIEDGIQNPGTLYCFEKIDERIPVIESMILLEGDADRLKLDVFVESLVRCFEELKEMAKEIDEEFNSTNNSNE